MVALSGGHEVRKGGEVVAVSQADVLAKTFSWEEVTFTLKRMASARDKDTFIAHPLRASVLIEFGEQLSEMISRLVIAGHWSPSASYLSDLLTSAQAITASVLPNLPTFIRRVPG